MPKREGELSQRLFDRAQRYVGEVLERPGEKQHPLIQWWISRCTGTYDEADELAWCSAAVNGWAWDERLSRSKSLRARSWLTVGFEVPAGDAKPGDVVILTRGEGAQPGPDVLEAPGHVGLFAGWAPAIPGAGRLMDPGGIMVLGGNQSNGVTVARFARSRLLGIRRLSGVG